MTFGASSSSIGWGASLGSAGAGSRSAEEVMTPPSEGAAPPSLVASVLLLRWSDFTTRNVEIYDVS
jgi:hypothetical protein